MSAHFEVIVIGAGISGVGAGVRLREAGLRDFLIIEAADDFGGTWRANTYPGCQCDVPSRLYSYSFAPNPDWMRVYAHQPEILTYVKGVADRHRLREHTRFGVRMTEAHWQPDAARWRISTNAGEFTARFLIAGAGPWNEPLIPEIPGLAEFPGEVFHSARWNHAYDLHGKRVAVLGSGASAVQFVPAIAPQVDRLHLFQRTAQWVLPKPDHRIPKAERWVMRHVPGARAAVAAVEYQAMEMLGRGFRRPSLLRGVQAVARAHLRATVRDRELRRKLTPDYTIGCKRILFSNHYYPALLRPNVDVYACAVRMVDGTTVLGADGSSAEVDAIILGTGFHILDMPLSNLIHDGAGRSLADHWQGSPEAYRGTVTAGFPNAFLLLGPGLGTGHSSAFTILEAQLDLAFGAIRSARAEGWASVEVRRDVQTAYNTELQAALAGTVYNTGGCRSYYLDANGRNSFSWPWSTGRLRTQVARFDARDFTVIHPTDRQELSA